MTRLLSGVRGLALCSLSLSVALAIGARAQEQDQKEGKPAAGKKEQEPKQQDAKPQEEFVEVPTPFGVMRIPKTPGGVPAGPATQPGTTRPAAQAGPATTTEAQTQGAGASQKAA